MDFPFFLTLYFIDKNVFLSFYLISLNKLLYSSKVKSFAWKNLNITGMNPKASFGKSFRSNLRVIIPSAFGGIVRLTNFNAFHL
jgi:hypothetical protein